MKGIAKKVKNMIKLRTKEGEDGGVERKEYGTLNIFFKFA